MRIIWLQCTSDGLLICELRGANQRGDYAFTANYFN